MPRSRWLGVAGLALAITVAVTDDGYEPATLELTAGEVVRLVNEGDSEHSFTAEDRSFDTGRMQPGEDVTLVLTEPGEIPFFDLADRDHEGTFVVQPSD